MKQSELPGIHPTSATYRTHLPKLRLAPKPLPAPPSTATTWRAVLPYPISGNAYWATQAVFSRRLGRWIGSIYVTSEARDYIETVRMACITNRPGKPGPHFPEGELAVVLRVYRARRVGDVNNCIDVLFDALNGVAWTDDKQVARIECERHLDRERPRVEIEVSPWP